MTVKLKTPHPFAERILLFGGGGVGKTNTALNVITHMPDDAHMYVVEQDYSLAYERALSTDFREAEGKVTVLSSDPEWGSFIGNVEQAVASGDMATDWLVIDPVSPSWDWVQEWALEAQHGRDLVGMMVDLKQQYGVDSKGYSAALSDMMNWNLVKKEYARLWKAIQRWKGHLILTAEAKALGNRDDDETRMLYGPLGFKPAGEARMKHVASTSLFLSHPRRGEWEITTIKDRNRPELDREPIGDFGIDYLQAVAGWERARRPRPAQEAE